MLTPVLSSRCAHSAPLGTTESAGARKSSELVIAGWSTSLAFSWFAKTYELMLPAAAEDRPARATAARVGLARVGLARALAGRGSAAGRQGWARGRRRARVGRGGAPAYALFSLTAPVPTRQRAPAGAMAFSASSLLTSTARRMISGSLGGSTSSGGSSAAREHTARVRTTGCTALGEAALGAAAERARLRTSLSHGRRGLGRRRELVADVARERQAVR